MNESNARLISIEIDAHTAVDGLAQSAKHARACLVLAHGAGAGMRHPFMKAVADGLAERQLSTLRFQFPYMQAVSKRPDRPPVAHAAVRAAVASARTTFPGTPLFAGGKSFGGRMTSQAQAIAPMEAVRGLIFLGFPLHPADKPSSERAEHLRQIEIPMLFLQGTRDTLAQIDRIRVLHEELAPFATLVEVEHADHSFHVLARSGRSDAEALAQLLDAIDTFVRQLLA